MKAKGNAVMQSLKRKSETRRKRRMKEEECNLFKRCRSQKCLQSLFAPLGNNDIVNTEYCPLILWKITRVRTEIG